MTGKRILIIPVILSLILVGCGRNNSSSSTPTPTPMPSGVSGTVNIRVTYDSQIPSLIERYFEAVLVPQANLQAQPLGKVGKADAGHTKGLPNVQDYKLSAQNLDANLTYQVMIGVYDSAEKKVQLFKGSCSNQADCLVMTKNNPSELQVKMVPVADVNTIYANSVPANLRAQCGVQPADQLCGKAKDRVYYDAAINTCKRFSFGGCGQIEPFNNMSLCQQACIR
jgi:hypothetical protein